MTEFLTYWVSNPVSSVIFHTLLVAVLVLFILHRRKFPPVKYIVKLYHPGGRVVVIKDDVKIYDGPLDDAPDNIIRAIRKSIKLGKYIRKRLED